MSLLLVAALLSADPSVQAAPAPVAQTVAPKPKKEKKICKSEDDTTGSHMVKRTCLTQEEWDNRVEGRSVDDLRAAPISH